jgi:hypothetical protein
MGSSRIEFNISAAVHLTSQSRRWSVLVQQDRERDSEWSLAVALRRLLDGRGTEGMNFPRFMQQLFSNSLTRHDIIKNWRESSGTQGLKRNPAVALSSHQAEQAICSMLADHEREVDENTVLHSEQQTKSSH